MLVQFYMNFEMVFTVYVHLRQKLGRHGFVKYQLTPAGTGQTQPEETFPRSAHKFVQVRDCV
jgi:hypothetical protein